MYVEKKRKIPGILVILLLLLIGVGVFFGVQYYLKTTHKKTEKKPTQVEENTRIPLTENEQTYILDKISFYDGMLPYGSFDASTLSFEKAFQFIETIKDKEYVDFSRGVSKERINEILKRYFGPKASISNESPACTDVTSCYVYDASKKTYTRTTSPAVGNIATKNSYIEGSKDKESKEILIKIKQLYYVKDPTTTYIARLFLTPEDASINQNPIIDLAATYGNALYNQQDYPNYLNQAISSVQESLPVITYTFQYQSGGYYLESVVK